MQGRAITSDTQSRLREDRINQVVSWDKLKKPGWGTDGESDDDVWVAAESSAAEGHVEWWCAADGGVSKVG